MLTIALLVFGAGVACSVEPQQVPVSVRHLSGEALRGTADPTSRGRYRVGDFEYVGDGVVSRSVDPRFYELVLDQQLGLRHRCGNAAVGPSAWDADDRDLSHSFVRIEGGFGRSKPSPGSVAAKEKGARPVLWGYVAGASWPVYSREGSFFLGLMHPENGAPETAIVAFRDVPQASSAILMAGLPMKVDTLNIVPEMHGPNKYLHLGSLGGGELTNFVLKLDPVTVAAAYTRVTGQSRLASDRP
jgi:hypothetical protein